MKNSSKVFGIFGMISLVFVLLAFTNQTNEYFDVGDVKFSILSPDVFNQTQSGTWVVLNGSNLPEDSDLYLLLSDNLKLEDLPKAGNNIVLPDVRGKFLRSMNINGEGDDPEKFRKIGSYQDDRIIQHQHTGYFPVNSGFSFEHHQPNSRLKGQTSTNKTGGVTGVNATSETRPKNIAFYTYIKISN